MDWLKIDAEEVTNAFAILLKYINSGVLRFSVYDKELRGKQTEEILSSLTEKEESALKRFLWQSRYPLELLLDIHSEHFPGFATNKFALLSLNDLGFSYNSHDFFKKPCLRIDYSDILDEAYKKGLAVCTAESILYVYIKGNEEIPRGINFATTPRKWQFIECDFFGPIGHRPPVYVWFKTHLRESLGEKLSLGVAQSDEDGKCQLDPNSKWIFTSEQIS
jgi:hypothetical protein